MDSGSLSYYDLVAGVGYQYCQQYKEDKLSAELQSEFENTSTQSLRDQKTVEQKDQSDFDTFLKNYFAQTL